MQFEGTRRIRSQMEHELVTRARRVQCISCKPHDSTSNVKSSLNKMHSAIAYHFSRWNVAGVVCTIAWITTGENIANAMTKRPAKPVQDYLFGNWTYWRNGFTEVKTIFYSEGTVCLCHHRNYWHLFWIKLKYTKYCSLRGPNESVHEWNMNEWCARGALNASVANHTMLEYRLPM